MYSRVIIFYGIQNPHCWTNLLERIFWARYGLWKTLAGHPYMSVCLFILFFAPFRSRLTVPYTVYSFEPGRKYTNYSEIISQAWPAKSREKCLKCRSALWDVAANWQRTRLQANGLGFESSIPPANAQPSVSSKDATWNGEQKSQYTENGTNSHKKILVLKGLSGEIEGG
jgi:hypothetical protein